MHEVTFDKSFAMSRYQITAGEWAQYMKETGITLPDGDTRPGRACTNGKPSYPQDPRQPAVCMNFAEVSAYVAWLSMKTGQHYHIVTHANTYGPTDGYSYSSPVGSYPANAFGLYDMHGNVYEWIADCYHPDYVGAPTDGSAWTEPNCDTLRIRGNDWGEAPVFSRSGNRNDIDPQTRGDWIGVRVVRTL